MLPVRIMRRHVRPIVRHVYENGRRGSAGHRDDGLGRPIGSERRPPQFCLSDAAIRGVKDNNQDQNGQRPLCRRH